MKNGLNRVKKSPMTTTRGQARGSRVRGSAAILDDGQFGPEPGLEPAAR
jgi:hypothetical protein